MGGGFREDFTPWSCLTTNGSRGALITLEGKVRRKLEKLLKGYEDVHFEAAFATGEGINVRTTKEEKKVKCYVQGSGRGKMLLAAAAEVRIAR
nr:probable arabinosyltransferase ARAD1 [Tanacetum cinerariifolium]